MFKKIAFLAALAVAATAVPSSEAWYTPHDGQLYNERGILLVGKDEPADVQVTAGVSRQDTISFNGASHISVKFDSFNLPPGDKVVVRNADGSVSYTYTDKGRGDRGTFYATFIPGSTAIVEYVAGGQATATTENFGYKIPSFAHGFESKPFESVCGGGDQSVPAKCFLNGTYHDALPLAYERSKTVARLLMYGKAFCTGWLVGSEGHLMTNRHCIEDEEDVANADIELGAESSSCEDECKKTLGCKGTVVTNISTLVTTSDLDYTVLKLPSTLDLKPFGYLQLRGSGPQIGEDIYVPQHPRGYAKRIAAFTEGNDTAYIQTVNGTKTCGDNQVGYSADTDGGASGSPVIAWSDNLVVALHHCGGCENQGVDVRDIIADLKTKKIVVKDLVAPETPAPPSSAPTPAPTASAPPSTTPAPTTKAPTTPAPSVRELPTPAPTPAPTTPAPGFCHKFTSKLQCQFWLWCNWDASAKTCANRF